MITIELLGLEDYTVGYYSKTYEEELGDLFEVGHNQIMIASAGSVLVHDGIDQTSWNCIARVYCSRNCQAVEKNVAKFLLETLSEFCINVNVEFYYQEPGHIYEKINPSYPRFLTPENMVNVEGGEYDENEEISDENMFEGFEEKYNAAHGEEECSCGHHHHHHDEECECHDEHCCCGHHHHHEE